MRHKNNETAEFDWSDPAAPSTHYEDTRQKLGAKTYLCHTPARESWTVACKGKHGSKHSPMEATA